jgi:hypothetical protein
MKKALLFMSILIAQAGLSWAADPIVGTWKLDAKNSRIVQMPRELTDVYRETEAGAIELSRMEIAADGKPEFSKWSWPKEGGMAERISPDPLPKEINYIPLLIDPGHWYVSIVISGKQSLMMHKTVSKGGRTLQITLKGKDTQGNQLDDLYIFERQ